MTDRHDDWTPEDDELVRRALMSLMDDVSGEPLPEPEEIRARADKASAGGSVTELGPRRPGRRSKAVLAAAAAAVLVTAGAGAIVLNQSPGSDEATSSSDVPSESTSNQSIGGTSAAPSRLRVLGPAEWQAVLGIPIEATEEGEPDNHCFQPAKGTTWDSRSARQDDGTRVAGQWIGTSPDGTKPLIRSVDQSVKDCGGYSQDSSIGDDLAGGGAFRAWHHSRSGEGDVWWVEVTDGTSASFLSVPESEGRTYDDDDIRTLARGVLGEVDLAQAPSTSSTSGSGTGTSTGRPDPTSTTGPGTPSTTTSTEADPGVTAAPPSTSSEGASPSGSATPGPGGPTMASEPSGSSEPGDGAGSGEGTGSGESADPTSSTSSTSGPEPVPARGEVPTSSYLPPSRWSSQALTGGEPAVGGPLELEGGPLTMDECSTTDGASDVGGLGIRSGEGRDNYFGRQFILRASTQARADRLAERLVEQYSGSCSGQVQSRALSGGGADTFALTQGDYTTYVAVVRQNSTTVSVLHVNTSKTAPRPLTDATAHRELARLAGQIR